MDIGKLIIAAGIILVIAGLLWTAGFRGLPGDIVIQKKNATFVFPIVTSLVLSLIATIILLLMRR